MFDLFISGWESLILILTYHFKNQIDYDKNNSTNFINVSFQQFKINQFSKTILTSWLSKVQLFLAKWSHFLTKIIKK
jgi:hypothetical protein